MSINLSLGQTANVVGNSLASEFHNSFMNSKGPFFDENLGNEGTDHSIDWGFSPLLMAISNLFIVFFRGFLWIFMRLHQSGGESPRSYS